MYWVWIYEKEVVCASCVHYHQHYVRYGDYAYYSACNSGHCSYPRIKLREPGHEACLYWEQAKR